MLSNYMMGAYIGAGMGYIYGYLKYVKSNRNKVPFYEKNKNYPLFYTICGFIIGGTINKFIITKSIEN